MRAAVVCVVTAAAWTVLLSCVAVVCANADVAPHRIWRDFLDATGTLHIDDAGVTCALNLRSHHPVLIDAGFADLETPIPWWDNRVLRFRFPPR